MNEIMKIAAIGVAAALCCVVIRQKTRELAVVLGLTAGAVILLCVFSSLEYVVSFVNYLSEKTGLSGAVFSPVLKVTGIALVTQIGGTICKDAGENGIAAVLELGGTVCALAVTVPLAKAILQTIAELI